MYYRGAQAAIVVYDITNQDTFGRAKTWVKELQRQASPQIVIALAGNKQDLANKRMVEIEEAQNYADENGLLFMETSAKTAVNVNDIFLAIGKSYSRAFSWREINFFPLFQLRNFRKRNKRQDQAAATRDEDWQKEIKDQRLSETAASD